MKKALLIIRGILMAVFAVSVLLTALSADSSIKLMIMFFVVAAISFLLNFFVVDAYLYIHYDVDSYFTR